MKIKTIFNKVISYVKKIDKKSVLKNTIKKKQSYKKKIKESSVEIASQKKSINSEKENLNNISKNFEDRNTDLLGETDYALYRANLKNIPPAIILLVGKPEFIGRQWTLSNEIEILGRGSSSSIVINDSSISKSHIKFQITSDYIVSVIDLQSTNGLIINSQKQKPLQPVALKNNDQIKLGNLIFKFLEKGNLEILSTSQLYQKSLIDSLTNISNKGAFETNITARMFSEEVFSLIIFDIDHFKIINDKHGHLYGDFILKEMSRVISSTLIRDEDFLARYGGEEFCLIVPQNISLAQDIAERLRNSIDNYNFNFQEKGVRVSISLGVTEKKISDTAWTDVFNRADKALYKSKAEGRNKVTVA